MLFMYASIYSLLKKKWIMASILYRYLIKQRYCILRFPLTFRYLFPNSSFALSVKMNILLFAPAFALTMFKAHMWTGALFHGCIILLIQVWPGVASHSPPRVC